MAKNKLDDQMINNSEHNVIAFHKAQLRQKEQDLNALQKKLISLECQNNALKESMSFRLGRIITLPLRFFLSLFKVKKKVIENPIKASVDSAFFFKDLIEINGWALSDSTILSVEVYLNDKLIKLADLGMFREDVMQSFPDVENSQFSGFSILIKGKLTDELSIQVTDEKNHKINLEKIIVPATGNMGLNSQYKIFLEQNKPNKHAQLTQLKNKSFEYQPLISIIVPVFGVDIKWLNACITSVINQLYSNWELCLYDDCSNNNEIQSCLNKRKSEDERIKVSFGEENKGIALASNKAIEMAQGDFIALLDNDDELSVDALLQVVAALNYQKDLDFIYSDEDKINKDGCFCDPHFKSDFNLASLRSWNYICHFSVIRKSLGDSINWFREGYDGAQDYDLFLRLATETLKIYHIPHVLYHWRKIEGSTAASLDNKKYVLNASKKALQDHLSLNNSNMQVEDGLFPNSFRISNSSNTSPKVSIIIPFKDEYQLTKACIESVLTKTINANLELILVNNQSSDSKLLSYIKKQSQKHKSVHVLQFDEPFNYARLNNWAIKQVSNDLVLFLNNDVEVINGDWLKTMCDEIQHQCVSAVGAKLLFEDNTIQHSGIVVSKIGAVHPNKGFDDGAVGYFQRANYVQNVSACTAACLLVKKSVFLKVGGFDEELFAIAYNDVDLCLKMRQAGYLITYTPYAKLYHYESKTRGYDNEIDKVIRFSNELKNFQKKWGEEYKNGDPYFNLNLRQTSENVCLNIK